MSAGHKLPSSREHLDDALNDPAVKRALARPFKVNRTWDLPYLAGYSKDGTTIYIDRHLPLTLKIGAKSCDPAKFLTVHEHVEKSLIDALGWKYAAAHQVATAQENAAVSRAGIDPAQYEKVIHRFVKADEIERLLRVPPDLDMTPYRAPPVDDALLRRVRMAQANPAKPGKITKADADYGKSKNKSRCGNCIFYENRGCSVVVGSIDPNAWCKYFREK